jgi:hypothetical protein
MNFARESDKRDGPNGVQGEPAPPDSGHETWASRFRHHTYWEAWGFGFIVGAAVVDAAIWALWAMVYHC